MWSGRGQGWPRSLAGPLQTLDGSTPLASTLVPGGQHRFSKMTEKRMRQLEDFMPETQKKERNLEHKENGIALRVHLSDSFLSTLRFLI